MTQHSADLSAPDSEPDPPHPANGLWAQASAIQAFTGPAASQVGAAVFRALPLPALLLDRYGRILHLNRSACQYLRLAAPGPRQVLLMVSLLRGPHVAVSWQSLLSQARDSESGNAVIEQQALCARDGTAVQARLRLQRLDTPRSHAEPVEFVCTLEDLGDQLSRIQAEHRARELDLLREQAERANAAKSKLLSRVSHELRTPLNAILGFAQLLQPDADSLPEAHRPYLGHILAAGRDLLSLVNEVLELNRAESGALRMDMVAVSLPDEAAMALRLNAVSDNPLSVTARLESRPSPPARADARRVREVLGNLISNAFKYNRFGGEVVLTPGHDAHWSWLDVQDQGIGLNAEQLRHLFEPFNRLGADRLQARGFGLGLSICKAYCEAMGGLLEVHSQPGEGSCFRLKLARWDRPGRWAPPPRPGPAAPAR